MMILPRTPPRPRNHGGEIHAAMRERDQADSIGALLQRQADKDAAEALEKQIVELKAAADRILKTVIWLMLAAAIGLMVLGLFSWAIDKAEAMPRYIEGLE